MTWEYCDIKQDATCAHRKACGSDMWQGTEAREMALAVARCSQLEMSVMPEARAPGRCQLLV